MGGAESEKRRVKSANREGGSSFTRVARVLLLFTSTCLPSNPGWAALTLSLEPDAVRVADPLTMTVTSDTPGLTWPDWAEALPGWDVVPQAVTDREAKLTLRSWLPGDIAVPALTVTTAGGVTFTTEPRTVAVNSVLPEEADVADATTLRDAATALPGGDEKTRPHAWWVGAAIGLGVLASAAAIWRLRREHLLSPEDLATERLDAAETAEDARGAVDAVRYYIETRFGHRLRHQTPAELAEDADAGKAMSVPLRDELIALQKLGDRARFSNERDQTPSTFITHARRVFEHAQAVAKEWPVEVKR